MASKTGLDGEAAGLHRLTARLMASESPVERRLGDLLERFEALKQAPVPKLARLERMLQVSADARDAQLLQVLRDFADLRMLQGAAPSADSQLDATLVIAGDSRATPLRLTLVSGGTSTTYQLVPEGEESMGEAVPSPKPRRKAARIKPRAPRKRAEPMPTSTPGVTTIERESERVVSEVEPPAPEAAEPEPTPGPRQAPPDDATGDMEKGGQVASESPHLEFVAIEDDAEIEPVERAALLEALASPKAEAVAQTAAEVEGNSREDPHGPRAEPAIPEPLLEAQSPAASLLDAFEATAQPVENGPEPTPATAVVVDGAESVGAPDMGPEPEPQAVLGGCDLELVARVPRRIAFMALAVPLRREGGEVLCLVTDQIDGPTLDLVSGLIGEPVKPVEVGRDDLLARLAEVYGEESAEEVPAEPEVKPKLGILGRLFGKRAA